MDADKVKKLTELAKRQHKLRLEAQAHGMTNVYALEPKEQLELHIRGVLLRAEEREVECEINKLTHNI